MSCRMRISWILIVDRFWPFWGRSIRIQSICQSGVWIVEIVSLETESSWMMMAGNPLSLTKPRAIELLKPVSLYWISQRCKSNRNLSSKHAIAAAVKSATAADDAPLLSRIINSIATAFSPTVFQNGYRNESKHSPRPLKMASQCFPGLLDGPVLHASKWGL